ncbi:phage head closure protein [Staphylococcus equorum]|uniref:phage head closure protein n=1 Tax=Staphylococcus equorum TaxID=246432 RepID=UPI000D1CCEFF|nr:phage head closure protein [Staphylococcus equorum]PTE43374.1 phage head-tail adapter protein [Staphylococcus equorum]RIL48121.1 phage head-tail adapter protein [Staphylococcus equorum]
MFNPFDEFPHEIKIGTLELVGNYPNQKQEFISTDTINGFMDTPSTSEQLKFYQMDATYDRNLYTPYHTTITRKSFFEFEGKVYESIGEPCDQGGMHEVNLTRLKVYNVGQS